MRLVKMWCEPVRSKSAGVLLKNLVFQSPTNLRGTNMDTDMVMVTVTVMVMVMMFMATAQLHQAMERQRKLSMKVYKEENMAIICFAPEKKN